MNNQHKFFMIAAAGVVLGFLPGCAGRRAKIEEVSPEYAQTYTDIDIPVQQEEIRSFFDEDINEFAMPEDSFIAEPTQVQSLVLESTDDLAWTDAAIKEETFKVIYFDFDKKTIRPDQEPLVSYDVEKAKEILEKDANAVLRIEGHACHSSGSETYNLALSEERARIVKDRFIAQGVPANRIKIVGRGQEIPAMVNGKAITGDKEEQWPNRRDEISIIYS